MDTVSRVFYSVAKDNLHTRKEIAETLGVSIVTVGKAVELLITYGILSAREKCESDIGRRSDFLEVSTDTKVLLLDLCERNLSYSLSPLGEASSNIITIPYVDSLDFADNLILLINDVKKHLDVVPAKIIVAVPGEVDGGRVKNALIEDYSFFDVADTLSKRGLCPDMIISCANAIETSNEFRHGDAFVSVSNCVWGSFGRGKIENWGNVTVDNRGELMYAEALRCSLDEDKTVDYSLRFLRALDGVLSPGRILLSCDRLSDSEFALLKRNIPKLVLVSANEMIFDGLMELAIAEILKEISNKR